ncbi:MAG: HXXEE domain-containing protein [Acidobacteriota bacterium]
MKFGTALWLSLVVFTLHNIEEYLTIQPFVTTEASHLPAFVANMIKSYTSDVFLTMLIIITFVGIATIFAGVRSKPHGTGMFISMCMVTGGLLINGIHHLGASLILLSYTPGVYTSAILLIPYSLYLCRRAILEDLILKKSLLWSAVVGIILMSPVILLSRLLATLIIS